MIDSLEIFKKADRLVQANGTRNAIELAEASGVMVVPVPYFKSLLGMYTNEHRLRAMYLNDRMDEYLTQTVAAHELGHDTLHKKQAHDKRFQEFELFRMNNKTEYEANAFASHLLIDTDKCVEYMKNGYDIVTVAKCMNTEINLLLIKCQELIKLGYNFRMPMEAHGDFLKKVKA